MLNYTLTGFADEISPNLDEQMTVLESLDMHYIEARGVDGKNLCDYTLEEAAVVKARLDARGFKLSAIGSPIGKIKITDDFEPHFEKFQHVCDLAKLFETPYIRMFSFFIPEGEDPEKYHDEVFRRMGLMIEEAKKRGIILLHENEKGIYGDIPERCLKLMEAFFCDNFRCTFDPANFVQCGAKPYPDGYSLLAPYLTYMHIKDAFLETGKVTVAGRGDGGVPFILKELADKNYTGFLSLEPHLTNFVGFADLEGTAAGALKEEASMGAKLFAAAHDSLMGLINAL